MPIVRILGTIHPTHFKLNSPTFSTSWASSDLGFPLPMEASIKDSKFVVTCTLPQHEEGMNSILVARSINLVRAFTDLVSFAMGIGFRITLDSFEHPDGRVGSIQQIMGSVSGICTAYKFPPQNQSENREFAKVLQAVISEPNLAGSMTDLADSLAHWHQTPTNCGRVLDSLRRAVAPAVKPIKGWKILQGIVNSDEAYMKLISDMSTDTRHGDRASGTTSQELIEVSRRTWGIMNRFIEFRKSGNVPLSFSDFPMLKG